MGETHRADTKKVPSVFAIERIVSPEHIDGLHHANNTVYVKWMEECATAHSAAAGWDPQAYYEFGASWVVRRHEIVYQRPALLSMRVQIETWVTEFKRVSSRRGYRFVDIETNQELARATTDWAFIDLNTGRPTRIPQWLIADFPIETERFDSV